MQRSDREPVTAERHAPDGWLSTLRGWFSRTVATRRGRAAVAGSALATAAAIGLAIMFVAGAFDQGEQARDPGASSGPSEQPRDPDASSAAEPVEIPINATFQMTATISDAIGVAAETEFVLTSEDDLAVDAVLAILHVEPSVELSVARESAGQYRISAGQPLEPGTVYRFLIADAAATTPHVLASFAFQTKTPVGVVQTIPRDRSTSVPINTGIELTFTQAGVQDIEGHFRIEPNVPGRFEVHDRVTVFVPQDGLAPGTLHTVTVTRGLTVEGSAEVMANDFVLQFETGESERTGEVSRRPVLNFTRKTAESATSEAPALETYTSAEGAVTLSVQVYRFDGLEGFLGSIDEYQQLPAWAEVTRQAFVTDTIGLDHAITFDAELQRLPQSGKSFIQFPGPLPAGFYLVRSEFNDQPFQAWLQVTDLATYAALAQDQTLVWVNDVSTQAPLAGARVEFIGTDVVGETGADGTLKLDTPAQSVDTRPIESGSASTEARGSLLITAADGRVAVVPLGSTEGNWFGYFTGFGQRYPGDDYWHYLSTDRPMYLPSDTIHFWGIARAREDPVSRSVTVQLTSHSYVGYNYQPVVVAEVDVETNALGTFTGELPFAGLSPDSYQLTMSVDGQVIGNVGVYVQTYTKPAYQISVTPDKLAAFAGDEITFAIDTTFLEGSPVPGLALSYSGPVTGQVTTDGNGHASVTVTAGEADEPSHEATTTYLTVTPVRAEEGEIIGEAWVSVYPARVTTTAQTDVVGDRGVISGTVHNVDLARINEGAPDAPENVRGDPAAGVTVSFEITDLSYRQVETGEYYDFIAKVVRQQYRYDLVELALGTFTAVTDANGAFRHTFPADQERQYRIKMRVADGQGRTASQQLYASGSQSLFNMASSYVYLRSPDGATGLFGGGGKFALGAPVSLAMYRGSDELPSGGANRYLFLEAQGGVHGYSVQASSTYQFDFAEDDVPSITVTGVGFNGRTYMEVNYGYHIAFDPAERGLTIDISPDRERYAPGDEATLDIAVTDENGNAQGQTEVNVSVVDEALFLTAGGATSSSGDILAAVYVPVSPGILRTYASHQYPNDFMDGGRGAATGGGPRFDFADVAFYGSATTDAEGHASVSFTLPDNLTSWRVTAQGFNDRIMVGTALRNIPVGLPFFADVTLSDEYLATDRPEVRLRSFGSALEASAEVTFLISAPSLGLDTPAVVTATAFQAAPFALPELREGAHEILIEARSGELGDSLVRTIRVVPSRLISAQTRFYELERGMRVEGSGSGPTRIAVSDHERGRYFGMLQQLTWGYGDRLDQMLARDMAAELLETFYEDVEKRREPFDAAMYQTPEGGIALFPYGGDDLALSARAAAVAPDRFSSAALTRHFLTVLEDEAETRERQLIALYGLAALGEPVLVPLQALSGQVDLTWRERLYVGLALVEVGDDMGARVVYQQLLDEYGESEPPNYRLTVNAVLDDVLEATSLAAILAAGVGDARAPQLFDYTTANYTTDFLVELEQISYLAQALPRLSSAPVRFAYTVDGVRTEVALRVGESLTIQVTPAQLAGLELEPIEGAAGVASFYTAPIDPASVVVDPEVTVTRTYGTDPAALHEGELVEVVLSAEFGSLALDGCYQLTDVLPSGLRPVARPSAWGMTEGGNYPYRIDGQRVSFCVSDTRNNRGATYWARVVSTGEYTAEPALIQSMQSAQSINFSAADQVIVR